MQIVKMSDFGVSIDNKQFSKQMRTASDEMNVAVAAGVNKTTKRIYRLAKIKAPYRFGNLKRSHIPKFTRANKTTRLRPAFVISGAIYARAVNYGIPGTRRKPNPFFTRAVEEGGRNLGRDVEREVDKVLRKIK